MHETPRLLKKPGGLYKRVENQDELAAALAEGWFVRLPVAETVAEPTPADTAVHGDGLADAPLSFAEQIATLSAKDAIVEVESSDDVEALTALASVEERVTVARAIEKRLDELKAT